MLTLDLHAWRAARREQPLRAYDALMPSDRPSTNASLEADCILQSGWRLGGHPAVSVQPPLAWDELCAANRSWSFWLHAWRPVGTALAAYQHEGQEQHLDFGLSCWFRGSIHAA